MPADDPRFGELVRCHCKEHEIQTRRLRVLMERSNLAALSEMTFESFIVDAPQRTAFTRARQFAGNPEGWLVLMGGYGTGKCMAATELVTLADGQRVPAGELAASGRCVDVLTLVDGVVMPTKARAEYNAIEPVFALETTSGRRVVRNAAHPLWTATWGERSGNPNRNPSASVCGWTPLSEIAVGDLVALTNELPAFSQSGSLTIEEAKLLGYLIGDGGYTKSSGVRFTQMPGPQLDEFCTLVEQKECRLVYHGGYDWRIIAKNGGPLHKGKRGQNAIIELLRRHDLWNKHSRDKCIPDAVWTASREHLCIFLSRLFATDGWASVRAIAGRAERAEIGFCSASDRLARDVQDTLVKLGIRSKLYKKGRVQAWTVSILLPEDIIVFADTVGIYGKEDAVARVRARASALIGIRTGHTWTKRKALLGTHWERVRSVTPLGPMLTVGIEVPDHHTYLTGFYEHNTHLAAAIGNYRLSVGEPVLFQVVPDLLDHLRAAYAPGSEAGYDELFESVRQVPLLILDDLGTQISTQWAQEKLFQLLNHRHNFKLPTVITTNKSFDEMEPRLASRMADAQISACVTIIADDFRGGVDNRARPDRAPDRGARRSRGNRPGVEFTDRL